MSEIDNIEWDYSKGVLPTFQEKELDLRATKDP